ncbi:MAG: hypothetical protein ABIR94_22050 [Rubrivivax sp.]
MPSINRREGRSPVSSWKRGPAASPALDSRRTLVAWMLASVALPMRAATTPSQPRGKVVLTITNLVGQPNAPADTQFDMAMIKALPQHSFVTRTPWFAAPVQFTGPLLRDVLSAAHANGSRLRAIALNDYRVDLPFEDVERHDVLLAHLLDDRPMTVRDKGPLFVIYPFDSKAELRNALYYSRAAWQLRTIEVS